MINNTEHYHYTPPAPAACRLLYIEMLDQKYKLPKILK